MIYSKTLICNKNIWDKHNHTKKQKTTITIDSEKSRFNVNDRKESACFYGLKLIRKKDGFTVVDTRFYSATGKTVNCCVWINLPGVIHTSGSDRAGGWGYDRKSAAFNGALDHCGIENFPHFSGSGCNREALEFLARVLGLNMKKHLIVEFYG